MPPILFTDGSVNTCTKSGYGGYLLIEQMDDPSTIRTEHIKLKRFDNTSSTKLELETLLWALGELSHSEITAYTDSQNILRLLTRRSSLEANDFRNRAGKQLNHHQLYRAFYTALDQRKIEIIQVKGHSHSKQKGLIEQHFALVDKATRSALRGSGAGPSAPSKAQKLH
ncbi:MAG: RNase H family protein [Verrucomicrobiota bacterium]